MFNKLVMSCLKSVLWYHNSKFVIEIADCFSTARGFWSSALAQPSPKNGFQLEIPCVWWEGVVPFLPVPVCWGWLHKVFLLFLLFSQDVVILLLKKCSDSWVKWSMSEIVLYRRKKYCCLVDCHDSYAGVFRIVGLFAGCKNSWDKSSLTSVNHVNLS